MTSITAMTVGTIINANSNYSLSRSSRSSSSSTTTNQQTADTTSFVNHLPLQMVLLGNKAASHDVVVVVEPSTGLKGPPRNSSFVIAESSCSSNITTTTTCRKDATGYHHHLSLSSSSLPCRYITCGGGVGDASEVDAVVPSSSTRRTTPTGTAAVAEQVDDWDHAEHEQQDENCQESSLIGKGTTRGMQRSLSLASVSSSSYYCSTACIAETSISQMSGVSISSSNSATSTVTSKGSSIYCENIPFVGADDEPLLPATIQSMKHREDEHQHQHEHEHSRMRSPPHHEKHDDTDKDDEIQQRNHHQQHQQSPKNHQYCHDEVLYCLTPSPFSRQDSTQPISFPKCKISCVDEEEEAIMSMEQSVEYYNACTWQMYHRIMKSRRKKNTSSMTLDNKKVMAHQYEELDSHGESLQQRQSFEEDNQSEKEDIFKLDL